MLDLILTVEVPIEHRRRELYASLAQAALNRRVRAAKVLLSCGAPLNLPGTSIETPLHAAVRGGNVFIVRLLLIRGANIETVNRQGYTPLMEATRRRNVNVITALLNAGE